jgi:hypothetical protein
MWADDNTGLSGPLLSMANGRHPQDFRVMEECDVGYFAYPHISLSQAMTLAVAAFLYL